MTSFTSAQILTALGNARATALKTGATVHVVARRTARSLFIKKALKTSAEDDGETTIIRDIGPMRLNDDMIAASTAALGHDPEKERVVLDMLRAITKTPYGEAFTAEEIAMIIWKLAENLEERDFQERRAAGLTRRAN